MNKYQITHEGRGQTILKSLVILTLSSIAVLWAWNTLAVDLFALPEMQFKHGFAVMVSMIAMFATLLVFKRALDKPTELSQ